MKRILLASHFFYPVSVPRSFRAFELAKELHNQGYCIDVLIGWEKKIVKNFNPVSWIKENENNNCYKEAASPSLLHNNYLKSLIIFIIGEKYFLTNYNAVKKLINIKNYNCVISIGLPFYIHYAVYRKIKSDNNIKSICDWGDPFFTSKLKIAKYWEHIQKKVLNSFDYITVPINGAKDYYEKYCNTDKIFVIPQGFDFDDIEIESYKKNTISTFAYAGNFYEDIRNPNELFDFLMTLDTEFKFIVFTNKNNQFYRDHFHKYEEVLGRNLIVNDIVPRLECIKELSKADFLINMENKVSIQAPSKLIDYSLSKRPIFSFTQGDFQKEQFISFLNGDYKYALSFDNASYNIKNVAAGFIKLIEE